MARASNRRQRFAPGHAFVTTNSLPLHNVAAVIVLAAANDSVAADAAGPDPSGTCAPGPCSVWTSPHLHSRLYDPPSYNCLVPLTRYYIVKLFHHAIHAALFPDYSTVPVDDIARRRIYTLNHLRLQAIARPCTRNRRAYHRI